MSHVSDQFVAAAFAEAGEVETARRIARRKPFVISMALLQVIALGVGSTLLYLLLYLFQDEILRLTAAGGWSFVVPVAIAFVFSLVHGAFTGQLWTAVGLTAKKK